MKVFKADIKFFFNSFQEHQALIQMDFAENYSVSSQHEIQQAHFCKAQVALFTAAVTSKDFYKSYIIVSDENDHGKFSVWNFVRALMTDLKKQCPLVTEVKYFTDGCAQQFKNIYTLSSLCHSSEDFGVKAEHHFMATSHGKGSHDGIGGSFKRRVRDRVLSENLKVTNATEFYEVAKTIATATTVLLVSKSSIENSKNFLNKRWENVKPMPGIRSCHSFVPLNEFEIKAATTSRIDGPRIYKIKREVKNVKRNTKK